MNEIIKRFSCSDKMRASMYITTVLGEVWCTWPTYCRRPRWSTRDIVFPTWMTSIIWMAVRCLDHEFLAGTRACAWAWSYRRCHSTALAWIGRPPPSDTRVAHVGVEILRLLGSRLRPRSLLACSLTQLLDAVRMHPWPGLQPRNLGAGGFPPSTRVIYSSWWLHRVSEVPAWALGPPYCVLSLPRGAEWRLMQRWCWSCWNLILTILSSRLVLTYLQHSRLD
jgi:hypothetical protein